MVEYKVQKISFEDYELAQKRYETFPYVKHEDLLYYYFESEKDGNTYRTFISNYFEIKEIIVDYLTKQHLLKIAVYHKDEESEAIVPFSAFSSKNLHMLRDVGIIYNPNKAARYLAEYADKQVLTMDKTTYHNKVGWWHNIQTKAVEFLGYDEEYTGDICLACSADNVAKQIKGLNRLIANSIACQVAVSIGFSSCIVGLLNECDETIETPIFHFYGDSSTGKSTALMLAASVWCKPEFGNGVFQSWNATDNAIMNSLNNNHGIILALDESSVSNKNFTNLVYCISQGIERGRMKKDGSKREQCSWNTSIISSGESSIISNCNNNVGISARVVEFPNIKITNSAKHSENIKRFCLKNYGAIGQAFIDAVCDNELDKIIRKEYTTLREKISSQIKEGTAIDNRLCRYYAILALCARYAKKFLSLNLDEEKIIDFLIEVNNCTMPSCSLFEKAYAYINEWAAANPSAFLNKEEKGRDKAGIIRQGRAYFFDKAFEDILKRGGFSDCKTVLHALKENGKLHCEKDRLKFRTTINGFKSNCYIVNLDVETDEFLSEFDEKI